MNLEENLEFDFAVAPADETRLKGPLAEQLLSFREFGKATQCFETKARTFSGESIAVTTYVNEFWTARQRAASSLHEISYRACFKPQLPRFFIERLTEPACAAERSGAAGRPGDIVYDPFMGRGTTVIEAALLGRVPCGSDINPLSSFLTRPRLNPPTLQQVAERLKTIDFAGTDEFPEDLLVFYHPETLQEICSLKKYLLQGKAGAVLDAVDEWIWMVALNRLTGHSPGFFSVYTLPPNQAVSIKSQRRINERRNQTPPRRMVPDLICRKTRQLLADCNQRVRSELSRAGSQARLLTRRSSATPEIASDSVSLAVTSPPFLDVVDYAGDNWLRCWLIGVDPHSVSITVASKLDEWQRAMTDVLRELVRVLRRGGHVAFEVGEVRGGEIKLEEAVLTCGVAAGLEPRLVLINDQKFTKTANCWGVDNNAKGTNTNRIVVFRKSA